jgi:hypothetical protein
MMRSDEQENSGLFVDNVLLFAALTRAHAGFGELRPPRCTHQIIA